METIPSTMLALQIDKYEDDLSTAINRLHVVTKATPKPGPGQVLIKIEAAPCNPADLNFLQGRYGVKKTLPAVPGWEGAGVVVAAGRGIIGHWLVGKRVACASKGDRDGTWAQYYIAEARTCVPLKKGVSTEQGSTLIVNPLTAIGLLQQAKNEGHSAVIQTAAASQVGRMVVKLAKDAGVPLINIVRRNDQAVLLKSLGASVVLNSEDPHFRELLKREASRLNATIAFDAVAGPMTGFILSAMPKKSKVVVYGALASASCSGISPIDLIFSSKVVEGFWLSTWISKQGIWGIYQATSQVQKLMQDGSFQTAISGQVTLEEAPEALERYMKEMTLGKVIITP